MVSISNESDGLLSRRLSNFDSQVSQSRFVQMHCSSERVLAARQAIRSSSQDEHLNIVRINGSSSSRFYIRTSEHDAQ
jgi:hypothetical protein